MEKQSWYNIFVDLKKAFNIVDQGRVLDMLEEFRVGTIILWLIQTFWDKAGLVCLAVGNYGKPFKAWRGVTQCGPL